MTERAEKAKIIGNKIKELREQAGMTQAKLAEATGASPETRVSRAAISLIEKGDRYPSLIILRKLAGALRTTVEELTGEAEPTAFQINEDAHAFFRRWGSLDELDENDKELIQEMVRRLKGNLNDKRGK